MSRQWSCETLGEGVRSVHAEAKSLGFPPSCVPEAVKLADAALAEQEENLKRQIEAGIPCFRSAGRDPLVFAWNVFSGLQDLEVELDQEIAQAASSEVGGSGCVALTYFKVFGNPSLRREVSVSGGSHLDLSEVMTIPASAELSVYMHSAPIY